MSQEKNTFQSDYDAQGFDLINVPRLGIGLVTDALPVTQLQVRKVDAAVNTVTDVVRIDHDKSGGAAVAAGYGTGILVRGANAAGTSIDLARISGVVVTATAGNEATSLNLQTRVAGGALTTIGVLQGGATGATLTLGNAAGVNTPARLAFTNTLGGAYIEQVFTGGLDQLSMSGDEVAWRIGGTLEGKVDNSGNILLGTGALAPAANQPFPCIPMMGGAPSGLPASVIAGMAPIVVDQTDTRFYWYQNQGVVGWYYVFAGAEVAGSGVNQQVAIWNGTHSINGGANFTWTGSLLTVTGAITQSSGALSLTGSAASSITTAAGALTITSAAAATWSAAVGALSLDAAAALNLGVTNATSVAIGKAAITTTITGGLTQLTGAVSITGNAASSLTTSAGALTLTSAAAATWKTSAGALTVDSAAALNLGISVATSVVIGKSGLNVAIGGTGSFGTGTGVLFLANTTLDPSTDPTGGGILYVSAGALTYRGSSGTVTTIGDA